MTARQGATGSGAGVGRGQTAREANTARGIRRGCMSKAAHWIARCAPPVGEATASCEEGEPAAEKEAPGRQLTRRR